MDALNQVNFVSPRTHSHPPSTPQGDAPAPAGDGYAGSVPNEAPDDPRAVFARRPTGHTEAENPIVGTRESAPDLVAGTRQSPKFLGSEAEYFHEARGMIANAKPGDMICLQMYEFENASTNGDTSAAKQAPGYADQQALLPALADAAARGVKVNVILDASHNPKTHDIGNAPVANYLKEAGEKSGNLTVDYYPPETVNIDHAKELLHLTPAGSGKYAVRESLVGGSNWGNHTPANDDGGGAFYGPDALGSAQIFFRDQAFCRGDRDAAPNPAQNDSGPVRWAVTAPTAEGGGSTAIRDAKLELTRDADAVYLNEFCLNHPGLVEATAEKGANAHVRVDPNELMVNKNALWTIRKAGGEAQWANTVMDPDMEGQKNHEKLDVYVKDGVATALTIGSANDTGNGLETTHQATNKNTGADETRKTNHEIDAIVTRVTDGDYSTAPFLDAAFAKTKTDLASRSLHDPPGKLSGTTPGQF